jgi:hypothetical protein
VYEPPAPEKRAAKALHANQMIGRRPKRSAGRERDAEGTTGRAATTSRAQRKVEGGRVTGSGHEMQLGPAARFGLVLRIRGSFFRVTDCVVRYASPHEACDEQGEGNADQRGSDR